MRLINKPGSDELMDTKSPCASRTVLKRSLLRPPTISTPPWLRLHREDTCLCRLHRRPKEWSPSTSTPDATLVRPIVRYHNIQSACPRPAAVDGFTPCPDRLARNARSYQITLANGTTQTFTTDDPGRLLLTGQIADLGVLDSTNLYGISKTAPYFHNNSAATLEEVVDHYVALFKRAARLNPPPNLPPIISSNGVDLDRGFINDDEREALLAYLRKL